MVHKIERWGDNHHPIALDIIRMALGIFLLLKGLAFMENSAYLEEMIQNQKVVSLSPGILMAVVYYVTFTHLVWRDVNCHGNFNKVRIHHTNTYCVHGSIFNRFFSVAH